MRNEGSGIYPLLAYIVVSFSQLVDKFPAKMGCWIDVASGDCFRIVMNPNLLYDKYILLKVDKQSTTTIMLKGRTIKQ